MSSIKLNTLVIMLCLWAAALTAHAQEVELSAPSGVKLFYKPFSGLPAAETFQLELRLPDDDDNDDDDDDDDDADNDDEQSTPISSGPQGNYVLRIRPSNLGKFVAESNEGLLPISISSANTGLFQQVNNEYRHSVSLANLDDGTAQLDYSLVVAESVFSTAATYLLSLDVDLIDTANNDAPIAGQTMDVEIVVEPKLTANLAGSVGAYEDGVNVAIMDFGKLTTGESQKIFIQVRGNIEAAITLTSEHDGKMQHKVNPDWLVDYSVDVDGVNSSLEAPLTINRAVEKSFRGSAYPLTVTIGDVTGSFSGAYQDIITIDVNPQ